MTARRDNVIAPKSYAEREEISAQQELDVLREFVVDLMGITCVDDLCWYVSQEVVGRLGFVDCVIYRFDPERRVLVQAAAMGAGKNPEEHEIRNQIEIPLGKGITGEVAQTHQAEIVSDASQDPRFISDVMDAQSEICVPLMHEGKLLGVLDCEDPRKDYFNDRHLQTLQAISSITSAHWVQCKLIGRLRLMQRDLEKALRESQVAQRAQSTFLASVSHELRTPLNAIVGFSSILTDSGNGEMPPETIAEFSQHIFQAGTHLTNIVDDVLDISALASEKSKAAPKELDLAHEIEVAVKLLSYMADVHGMVIETRGLDAKPMIMFDPRHIKQILTNLLDNAIKYSPGAEQVILAISPISAGGVVVSIQDFGVGLPQKNLSHIFEPFWRETEAVDRNIEGTGLGLCLVREMAQANCAEISVVSQLGIGSTFSVNLPAALSLSPSA